VTSTSPQPTPPRPPEAPRPLPPLRKLVRVRTWFLLAFGAPFLLNGIILTTVFSLVGGPPWDDWLLDRRAVRADARPLEVGYANARRNGVRVQTIRFRFLDDRGVEREAEQATTDRALIARARAGETLPIELDPTRPSRVRIAGERVSFFGAFTLIPIAFGLVGLGCVGAGVRGIRRERAIYRDGEAGLATVTRVARSSVRVNRRRAFRVEYDVQTLTAGVVRGRCLLLDPPSEGARIWVLYDPARPTDQVIAVPV